MSHFFSKKKLSFSEIVLIPEALVMLCIFRLKVSYQPSRKWMPKATSERAETTSDKKMGTALLVVKVINGLETRTPWRNTCLVKALAVHSMLQKRQIVHKIHIGVAPKENKSFEAHAWLSVGTEIILGGGNLDRFHEISSFR
ncbi:lasso peptide biosynthesis B2 protein [Algibacter mikhailovii]|uniref:Microcin J25-processing protein McjB C-terminal domain-containing protein n=1 Tax=Algibacter mikhailovii TaxID=425498 RepID=A0A918QX96_9FLAO|nr:lasso peptide biosynthesis B2 protein [Algibacter mikhailovii]GGZ75019.1 hypothetical protein GCM10007028_10540 [Algibacter mikhailovii]